MDARGLRQQQAGRKTRRFRGNFAAARRAGDPMRWIVAPPAAPEFGAWVRSEAMTHPLME
jgi:hypothetical protein